MGGSVLKSSLHVSFNELPLITNFSGAPWISALASESEKKNGGEVFVVTYKYYNYHSKMKLIII